MHKNLKTRLLALFLLAALLIAYCGTAAAVQVYPNHHCDGEHCSVCLLVQQARHILHHDALPGISLAALVLTFLLVGQVLPSAWGLGERTLITLKVKLSD